MSLFEDITEESLVEEAEEMGIELEVDTREGSIYMDAAMGHITRTAKFYSDLDMVYELFSIKTCTGEILDNKALERGLTRGAATNASWSAEFIGDMPALGTQFLVNDTYLQLIMMDGQYLLEAMEPGSIGNSLLPGSSVIPDEDTSLQSVTLGTLVIEGKNEENDDSFRNRLLEAYMSPNTNANKSQYKAWCESEKGVKKAKILPLWDGPNTVKGLLISPEGKIVSDLVVKKVQDYIDPNSEGLGEGVAPIGAHFTAESISSFIIDVSFYLQVEEGFFPDTVIEICKQNIILYFKELTLNSNDEKIIVKISQIGSILMQTKGVKDYKELKINQDNENITLEVNEIPLIGEVKVDAIL